MDRKFDEGSKGTSNYTLHRRWEHIEVTPSPLPTKRKPTSINILSYNILSQTLLESHRRLYFRCSQSSLNWSHRFNLIRQEIIDVNPNIICLQELQFSHLDEVKKVLKKLKYILVYKKRTGDKPDGCAICYKNDEFHLIDEKSVELLQPDHNVLKYDNVGIMVKLRSKVHKSKPFVVCTTHFLFNTKRIEARISQLRLLLAELDRFSYCCRVPGKGHHLPIILCGDFNSKPDSLVTQLVTRGKIHDKIHVKSLRDISITTKCQYLDVYLNRIGNPETNDKSLRHNIAKDELFKDCHVEHNFVFKSVYNHLKTNGKREATVHQSDWVVVDYIYFCSNNVSGRLILKERYYLPTVKQCYNVGAIPNGQFGSDHISLAAKFELYSV